MYTYCIYYIFILGVQINGWYMKLVASCNVTDGKPQAKTDWRDFVCGEFQSSKMMKIRHLQ